MYTVIRFTSFSVGHEVHERIGGQLDVLIPGAYRGLRPAGDGFASELSKADSWGDHRIAIIEFIRTGHAAIMEARRVGIDVCVDIAIGPEDYAGTWLYCLQADPELMRMLGEADVGMEFSVYGAGIEDDGADA